MTRCAYASRSVSHDPSRSSIGPYCVNAIMMCLPSGASPDWCAVGNITSAYGCSDARPYFASSNARSRYSMEGEIAVSPRCMSPSWSHDGYTGSSDSPRLIFTEPERER